MLTAEEIAALCTAGGMAPSGGNVQPWRVTAGGGRLVVRRDERRSDDTFLDVGGLAAHFAVGCFAENITAAARSLGLGHTTVVSDGAVEVTFTGRRDGSTGEVDPSITERVTNRRPFDGTELSEAEIGSLTEQVDPPHRVSAVSASDARGQVARALGAADVLRMRHPEMFAEMVREMCWTETETAERREGLDLRTLELPRSTATLLSVLRRLPALRTLLPAGKLADTARHLVANCSHICCLSTSERLAPSSMVTSGMALQRLWLEATRRGIAVHPWTVSTLLLARLEAFEGRGLTGRERDAIARFGRDLRAGFGLAPDEHPVFVFRLFRAPPPAVRSLRRPWPSFTTLEEDVDGSR